MAEIILREQRHLDDLVKSFSNYFQLIEKILRDTQNVTANGDTKLAMNIYDLEEKINQDGADLHDLLVEYLALFAPIGQTLRRIVGYLQIRIDLERMGDLCKKISREVIEKKSTLESNNKSNFDNIDHETLDKMFEVIFEMYANTIESLTNASSNNLREVIRLDKELNTLAHDEIEKFEGENKTYKDFALIRQIEKIGDSLKNIYEQSYYIKKGQFYEM